MMGVDQARCWQFIATLQRQKDWLTKQKETVSFLVCEKREKQTVYRMMEICAPQGFDWLETRTGPPSKIASSKNAVNVFAWLWRRQIHKSFQLPTHTMRLASIQKKRLPLPPIPLGSSQHFRQERADKTVVRKRWYKSRVERFMHLLMHLGRFQVDVSAQAVLDRFA